MYIRLQKSWKWLFNIFMLLRFFGNFRSKFANLGGGTLISAERRPRYSSPWNEGFEGKHLFWLEGKFLTFPPARENSTSSHFFASEHVCLGRVIRLPRWSCKALSLALFWPTFRAKSSEPFPVELYWCFPPSVGHFCMSSPACSP